MRTSIKIPKIQTADIRDYRYGRHRKVIVFGILEAAHVEFKLKLTRDGMSQKAFFKLLLALYLKDNKKIRSIVDDFIAPLKTTRKAKQCAMDTLQAEKTARDFGLTEEDFKNIYDELSSGDEDE